jgi:hypothetical protein
VAVGRKSKPPLKCIMKKKKQKKNGKLHLIVLKLQLDRFFEIAEEPHLSTSSQKYLIFLQERTGHSGNETLVAGVFAISHTTF